MTAGVVGFCTGIDFRFFVALLLRITMALSGHIERNEIGGASYVKGQGCGFKPAFATT